VRFNNLVEVAMIITANSGTTSSSSTKVYDKRDLNKDGVVPAAEEMQYAIQHPDEAKKNQAVSLTSQDYTQQGKMRNNTSGVQSTFDIYV
jgi:hypothetical protein